MGAPFNIPEEKRGLGKAMVSGRTELRDEHSKHHVVFMAVGNGIIYLLVGAYFRPPNNHVPTRLG